MINELKRAITERLQPLREKARIIANDDIENSSGSNTQVQPDYQIRIGYAGGSYNPPQSMTVPFQEGKRSFEISLQIKDLLSEDKTVVLLEKVEDLVIGFCPCVRGVTSDFYLESDRFVQNRNGVYFYVILVAINCKVNNS